MAYPDNALSENPDPFVLTPEIFAYFAERGMDRQAVIDLYHKQRGTRGPFDGIDINKLRATIADIQRDMPMREGETHREWVDRVILAMQNER